MHEPNTYQFWGSVVKNAPPSEIKKIREILGLPPKQN